MDLNELFGPKYSAARLRDTSSGRGWQRLAAEVRSHPAGTLPARVASQTEVTVAISDGPGFVNWRRGSGQVECTRVLQGTTWLCPVSEETDETTFTDELPAMLHLFIPGQNFEPLADDSSPACFAQGCALRGGPGRSSDRADCAFRARGTACAQSGRASAGRCGSAGADCSHRALLWRRAPRCFGSPATGSWRPAHRSGARLHPRESRSRSRWTSWRRSRA